MRKLYKWFLFFIARLSLLFVFFLLLYGLLEKTGLLYQLQLLETGIVFFIAKFFYPQIQVQETVLKNLVVLGQYSAFSVEIEPLCLGYYGIASIITLFLALPGVEWKKKKKCILLGVPAIFAVNILRILSVLFSAAFFGLETAGFVHSILFKADLAFFIMLIFFGGIHFIIKKQGLLQALHSF